MKNIKEIKKIARIEAAKITVFQWLVIIGIVAIVGFASATTITSNRLTGVQGVNIDLSNKVSSIVDDGYCTPDVGVVGNMVDSNLATYYSLGGGGGCTLTFTFDKNYTFTRVSVNASGTGTLTFKNSLNVQIISYPFSSGISSYEVYEYKNSRLNVFNIATSSTNPLNITEIKFYGIDEDI